MSRTFTLNEAQTLLPVVEALLRRAQAAVTRNEELEHEMQQLAQRIFLSGGLNVDITAAARQKAEREKIVQEAKDSLAEIDSIGVQVKDVDAGLLDFPCRLEDQVVLLCWQMGETTIEHWHTVEDGFKGRQPVDERFRRRSNSSNRPN